MDRLGRSRALIFKRALWSILILGCEIEDSGKFGQSPPLCLQLDFFKGYKATDGELLTKNEICEEAIRLGGILLSNPHCDTPEENALMALMCLNASRLNARINQDGDLCTLENQDRAKWDAESIEWGFYFLK